MIEHLVASTIAALIAVVAALALRRQSARLRCAILFLALLRFAIPTQWLTNAGSKLAGLLPSPGPSLQVFGEFSRLVTPTSTLPKAPKASAGFWTVEDAASLIWAGVFSIGLAIFARRAFRTVPTVRQPDPAEIDALSRAARSLKLERRVALRITAADRVPGALGLWRPTVVLPDGLSTHLSEAELQAVLAHELAHVRRHDNLSAAAARVIVSVFWFHPLLWWIERWMLSEREAACDEVVLSHGARPEDYVAGLLKVCRMSFAGAAGYAGATGSNLRNRMEQIMSSNFNGPLSRSLRALPGILVAIALLVPVTTGFLRGQTRTTTTSSSIDALYRSAAAYFNEGRYQEAEEAFRKIYQLDPGNFKGIVGLAEVYMRENKQDEAIRFVQSEADKNPTRLEFRTALGNLLVRVGKDDLAIAEFQRALDSGTKDSKTVGDLYFRIGEANRRMGDLNAAIRAFQQAKAADPKNTAVLLQIAMILDGTGRQSEVKSAYDGLLKAEPDNAVALNNLAFIKAEEGVDLDGALAMAQRALQKMPNSPDIMDTIGWIYLKKSMSDDAIAAFRNAVQAATTQPAFHYHLAMALIQKGDNSGAMQELQAALKNNPSNTEEQQIRELMQKVGKIHQ
jgi:beta-lactamase regulating signal transducer with metallopeptidase domain/tetratricopeptide (TPR) repeat protein